MPFKLLNYLLNHAAIGLALSATAVLGFAYMVMIPTSEGSLFTKILSASQQLLQISHLFFPLVVLIGLGFGLGLLHNHKEIVLMLQLKAVRISLAAIILLFMLFTVISERILWPSLMTPAQSNAQQAWYSNGNMFILPKQQAIQVENGKIIAFSHQKLATSKLTNQAWQQAGSTQPSSATHWLKPPTNTKAQYAWWQQWYQALWPVPLFWLLWQLVNKSYRGSNATSISGGLAGLTISAGLLAEAGHIILSKALITPALTLFIPLAGVTVMAAVFTFRRNLN